MLAFDEIRYLRRDLGPGHAPHAGALQDLKEQVPPERRPALEHYLARVDNGIRRDFEDDDDQRDALEEDRQGLGLSRERKDTALGTGA